MELRLEKSGPAPPEDCAALFYGSAIYERYFQGGDRLERALCRAAERGELYLARTDTGELAGAMRVVMDGFCGLYPYLCLIGVGEAYRSRGVGSFLMDRLEEMGRATGARRVSLMVSDFNTGAQAFYRRRGYWLLGDLPDGARPGITERVMLKDLTPPQGEPRG